MTPLNMYLTSAQATPSSTHAMIEYGNAIKELAAANIFPGDMLYKNFGVTRHGRVVFYDYDEIEYMTDCNFRVVAAGRTTTKTRCRPSRGTESTSATCSPSSWGPFLLGDDRIRAAFLKHHADLLDAGILEQPRRSGSWRVSSKTSSRIRRSAVSAAALRQNSTHPRRLR